MGYNQEDCDGAECKPLAEIEVQVTGYSEVEKERLFAGGPHGHLKLDWRGPGTSMETVDEMSFKLNQKMKLRDFKKMIELAEKKPEGHSHFHNACTTFGDIRESRGLWTKCDHPFIACDDTLSLCKRTHFKSPADFKRWVDESIIVLRQNAFSVDWPEVVKKLFEFHNPQSSPPKCGATGCFFQNHGDHGVAEADESLKINAKYNKDLKQAYKDRKQEQKDNEAERDRASKHSRRKGHH